MDGLMLYTIAHVTGRCMEPTVPEHSSVILRKIFKVKRGDIVVVHTYLRGQSSYLCKRVIGLPGETVSCKDDEIYINGQPLEESYINGEYKQKCIKKYGHWNKINQSYNSKGKEIAITPRDFQTIKLADDEYFLCGDNRPFSKDSRDELGGPFKKSQMYGKIVKMISFDKVIERMK